MKLHRILTLTLAIQLFAVLTAFGQGNYQAASIGAAPAEVPAGLASTLEAQGARVTGDGGAVLCEVWLRKIAAHQREPHYLIRRDVRNFAGGGVSGRRPLPKDAADFRSQPSRQDSIRYALA